MTAGEQVFISYGPLSNSKLLMFYGFTLPGNPYDTVRLKLESSQTSSSPSHATTLDAKGEDVTQKQHDLEQEARLKLLAMLNVPLQGHDVRSWGPLPPLLMAHARVSSCSGSELSELHELAFGRALTGIEDEKTAKPSSASNGGKKNKKGKSSSSSASSRASKQDPEVVAKQLLARLSSGPFSVASERAAFQILSSAIDAALYAVQGGLREVTQGGQDSICPAQVYNDNNDTAPEPVTSDSEASSMDGEEDADGVSERNFISCARVYLEEQERVLFVLKRRVLDRLLEQARSA